jgi:hypothetical protein
MNPDAGVRRSGLHDDLNAAVGLVGIDGEPLPPEQMGVAIGYNLIT